MFSRFRNRSHDLEHIDTGNYTPEEYEGSIIELQRVNKWLGDVRALRLSMLKAIANLDLERFSVLDAGAGSGELLRVIADWSRRHNRGVRLTGLELNARSARSIVEHSNKFEEIEAVRGDALRLPFTNAAFDYVVCSLFTHHFTDSQILCVLRELARVARRQIFVIDLHRHPVAYYFYITVGRLILHTRLLREDGALSILRSFKPDEFLKLAELAGLEDINVVRKFPYRLVLSARGNPSEASLDGFPSDKEQDVHQRIRVAS